MIICLYLVSPSIVHRPLRNENQLLRFMLRSIAYIHACVMHNNTKRGGDHVHIHFQLRGASFQAIGWLQAFSSRFSLYKLVDNCWLLAICRPSVKILLIHPFLFCFPLADSRAQKGIYQHAIRYHGRGYRFMLNLSYCHYVVCLKEGPPPEPSAYTGYDQAEDYLKKLRRRYIIGGVWSVSQLHNSVASGTSPKLFMTLVYILQLRVILYQEYLFIIESLAPTPTLKRVASLMEWEVYHSCTRWWHLGPY